MTICQNFDSQPCDEEESQFLSSVACLFFFGRNIEQLLYTNLQRCIAGASSYQLSYISLSLLFSLQHFGSFTNWLCCGFGLVHIYNLIEILESDNTKISQHTSNTVESLRPRQPLRCHWPTRTPSTLNPTPPFILLGIHVQDLLLYPTFRLAFYYLFSTHFPLYFLKFVVNSNETPNGEQRYNLKYPPNIN